MANLTPRQVMQRINRLQGPEQEQTVAFAPISTIVLPASLKTDKFIWGLQVRFHGRVTSTGGFTPLTNSLWNLIQEFRVRGTHRVQGAQMPFRQRGSTVYDLSVLFGRGFVPAATVAVAGSPTPFAGATGVKYDVDVIWTIPFGPRGVPLHDQIVWGALKGPDWAGDLHLEMDTGDGTSLGSTASDVALTGYGADTGTPQLLVSLIRPNMTVALQNAITPAICFKSYVALDALLQAASFVGQKIADLNTGKGTSRVILKAGVLQTSVSAGVAVYASLSDGIITRSYPSLDGKPTKNPFSNLELREYENLFMQANAPTGYQVLDWIEGGSVLSAFPSQGLDSSRRFQVDGDVVAASNQGGERIQEELLGSPVILPVAA